MAKRRKKTKNKKTKARTKAKTRGRKKKKISWVLALIMSIMFGHLGVDRFIMGMIGTGILKLITFGGFGIWYIIDIVLIATKKFSNIQWVK